MNAITRVSNQRAVRYHEHTWTLGVKLLILLLILSAFGVVYLKDLNRRLFIEYQDMAHANQQAQIEWGRLMLEQSTLAAQANIQQKASARLNMLTPAGKDIVLVNVN